MGGTMEYLQGDLVRHPVLAIAHDFAPRRQTPAIWAAAFQGGEVRYRGEPHLTGIELTPMLVRTQLLPYFFLRLLSQAPACVQCIEPFTIW